MKSNNRVFTIGIILCLGLIVGCENDPVPETSIGISIETPGVIYAGETVEFIFDGEAEKIAVFTGDALHVYDSLPAHTGFAVEGNVYSYEYNSMGTFKVVAVATSLGHWGEKEDMKTDEIYVDVIDNRTGISRISVKVLSSKKTFRGEIEDDQIIFSSYNGEGSELVECNVRLMSPDAKIYMNGNRNNAYGDDEDFEIDLSNNPEIIIVAPDGTERMYLIKFTGE